MTSLFSFTVDRGLSNAGCPSPGLTQGTLGTPPTWAPPRPRKKAHPLACKEKSAEPLLVSPLISLIFLLFMDVWGCTGQTVQAADKEHNRHTHTCIGVSPKQYHLFLLQGHKRGVERADRKGEQARLTTDNTQEPRGYGTVTPHPRVRRPLALCHAVGCQLSRILKRQHTFLFCTKSPSFSHVGPCEM